MSGSIEPGSTLGGSYRIVRSIGQGRMGEVFEAAHARLGGRYAVTMLAPEVRSHPDLLQQFAHEAKVTSSLRHPAIVQVIDFDTTPDGPPYLVVELLEGEDLGRVLAREGRLPLERTIAITRQIASALAAAHRQDVIHRDLMPRNIFLSPPVDEEKERVKVLGFGMSKMRLASQNEGLVDAIGTPPFMAPEGAQGDAGVDQFSLAAIVYEMLAGQPAFRGGSPGTIPEGIVSQDPVPLRELRPDLPAGIDAVLARALSTDRALRFPSIAEFSRELRVAAQTGEETGKDTTPEEPPAPGSSDITVIRAVPRGSSAADAEGDVVVRGDGRGAGHRPDDDGRPHARQPEESAPVVLEAHPRADRAVLVVPGGSGPAFRPSGAPRRAGDERVRHSARARFRQALGSPRVRPVLGAAGAVALLIVVTAWVRAGGRPGAIPASGSTVPTGAMETAGQVSVGAPSSPGQAAPAMGTATKRGPTIEPIVEPLKPGEGTAAAASDDAGTRSAPTVQAVAGTSAAIDGTGGAAGETAGLTFELASEPPGLPVWIDGKPYPDAERQAHTSTRGRLPAGAHRIEVVASEGYEPWRKTIDIRADRANRFLARLKAKDPDEIVQNLTPSPTLKPGPVPEPATTPNVAGLVSAALVKPAAPPTSCALSVGSLPWATIWVDGQSTGRHTPTVALPLPCGKHVLQLKRDDQPIDFTTEIVLLPGTVLKRVFQFGPAGQRLAK